MTDAMIQLLPLPALLQIEKKKKKKKKKKTVKGGNNNSNPFSYLIRCESEIE